MLPWQTPYDNWNSMFQLLFYFYPRRKKKMGIGWRLRKHVPRDELTRWRDHRGKLAWLLGWIIPNLQEERGWIIFPGVYPIQCCPHSSGGHGKTGHLIQGLWPLLKGPYTSKGLRWFQLCIVLGHGSPGPKPGPRSERSYICLKCMRQN